MAQLTYPQTILYLESLVNYEKKPDNPYKDSLKLERVRDFLRLIGDPQDKLRCIHIAGTKGKGSTCAFCAYILRAAGFKTGLYTSPHLSDFRERIRILDPGRSMRGDFEGMISKKELAHLAQRLRPKIDRYNKDSQYGPLTFFEVYTALAFVYFLEKKIDFAVLETGLGGRLDATNTTHPLVAAITPISLEHTRILGRTLTKIAAEKAGIIKDKGVVVISAAQKKPAAAVIRKTCRRKGARLYEVGRDIKFHGNAGGFRIDGINGRYESLETGLLGGHQRGNAAVAVGIIEALRNYDIDIGAAEIKKGIAQTRWPGRCEVAAVKPWIVLDGAQNAASSGALKKALRKFSYKKLVLILGISSDKDIKGICRNFCPLADKIILTAANSPRAALPEKIAQIIRSAAYSSAGKIIRTTDTRQAARLARRFAGKDDLILVTGSLFVVGELRDEFHG